VCGRLGCVKKSFKQWCIGVLVMSESIRQLSRELESRQSRRTRLAYRRTCMQPPCAGPLAWLHKQQQRKCMKYKMGHFASTLKKITIKTTNKIKTKAPPYLQLLWQYTTKYPLTWHLLSLLWPSPMSSQYSFLSP
jgi:hypothetical protein